MHSADDQHLTAGALNDLLAALRKLKPTGAKGFEGLLAVVLGRIAGVDFRLAKSGLQNGKDGETLAVPGTIAFEGKLYKGRINDNEVLTKITRLIASNTPPDVWVLGATVEASTQLLEPMQAAAIKNGIGILVLDWPATSPMPPLAAACVCASEQTVNFLGLHISDPALVKVAGKALATLKSSEAYARAIGAVAEQLQAPSLALAIALRGNQRWLEEAFGSRQRAKAVFGQVLAPAAPGSLSMQERPGLVRDVAEKIESARQGEVVALIGPEGNGKSWLVAESWSAMSPKPLTLIVGASDFRAFAAQGSIPHLLVSKLVEQTKDHDREVVRMRWARRLTSWGERGEGEAPRFVLVLDGLNEQPDFDWPRWLDNAAMIVAQHGGVLVVTAREAYFHDRIRSALVARVETIQVPEWSPDELRRILALKGVQLGNVSPPVFERLRNPRILGIACALLDNAEIEAFQELTVERLLFEHLRVAGRLGVAAERPSEFSARLARHAQEVMDRATREHEDDIRVFDQGGEAYELTADLMAVTAEHFFRPLPESPSLYSITDEGLSLALGLAIVAALQRAERAKRDVGHALGALIDPIAALDKAADAVFAALLVASIDPNCTNAIQRALIGSLMVMQNIQRAHYPAFEGAIRRSSGPAMEALYDLSVGHAYVANWNWLLAALRACRGRASCWATMEPHLLDWLRSYSLNPTLAVYSRRTDGEEKYLEELNEKTARLEERHRGLPPAERAFLDGMPLLSHGDPANLHSAALELLAGIALAPFAAALVACSYSMSFNSSPSAPYGAFKALCRYNRVDWSAMRTALLEAASFLKAEDSSRTALWALVGVLRGTSTSEDAAEEEALVAKLRTDQHYAGSWRRVERYCATDPCDPGAVRPENIEATATSYRQIKISEVDCRFAMTGEDHFFRDARLGLVRFEPDVAILVQRLVAAAIVKRSPPELERGIIALQPHSAVIDAPQIAKLTELTKAYAAPLGDGSKEARDAWRISQFSMLLAMPHLTGNQQVSLLRVLPPHGPPLIQLAESFKPAEAEQVEVLLEQAIQSGDRARKITALSFVEGSNSDLTPKGEEIIARLIDDPNTSVRALAMDVACDRDLRSIVARVARGGWSAAQLDPKDHHYELWYGSSLLVRAAELGLIDPTALVERISPQLYGHAIKRLGAAVSGQIAARLLRSIQLLLEVPPLPRPPLVEQNQRAGVSHTPPSYSLADPKPESGLKALFERMSEEEGAFEARQEAGWEAFSRFAAELTRAKARLAIEDVGHTAISACVSVAPVEASRLAEQMLGASSAQLYASQNFALRLARSLSVIEPVLARRLFDHLLGNQAYVHMTYGMASVPLEALCVWGSANCAEINELRAARLDRAANDHELAVEVLAALQQRADDFLFEYARGKLASEQPADIGRGLMVVGFAQPSTWSEATLARFRAEAGLIGEAAEAATFAYDRNLWARHWYERMQRTDRPEEFWCWSWLFLKVVDGRFDMWEPSEEADGPCIKAFGRSLNDTLRGRLSAWKSKREKTLLGDKTPNEIFLEPAG